MRGLRNCWYVVAWSDDLVHALTPRTVLGEPLVLYRTQDGDPVALADLCPHRYAPLSMGTLVDDGLQCAYHGLVFNQTGACCRVPGQRAIPPGARVKAYPTVDKWRWTWIWMGDPDLADETLIPDYHWNEDGGWAMTGGVIPIKAHYQLLVDNLMDLSHEAYLHPRTIGNAAVAEEAEVKTERRESGVRVTRWTRNCPTPPLWKTVRGHTGNIDRWQIIDFIPPSFVILESGSALAGIVKPTGPRDGGVTHMAMFAITPETETSSHYFWSNARDYRQDDEAVTAALHQGILFTFQEDSDMLEAQQRNMERCIEPNPIDINADQGGLQARRIVDRLIAGEAERVAAS